MKTVKLKSTGQIVHPIADDKTPTGYQTVMRPYLPDEGMRTNARGEVLRVRNDSLVVEKD